MSRSMRVLGLLLPLVAVASCGSDSYTLGSACSEVGSASCNRADDCGVLDSTVSVCQSEFKAACCGDDGSCGEKVPPEIEAEFKQAVHTCANSFDDYTCEELDYYEGITLECAALYGAVVPAKVATPVAPVATPLKKLDVRKLGKVANLRFKQVATVGVAQ